MVFPAWLYPPFAAGAKLRPFSYWPILCLGNINTELKCSVRQEGRRFLHDPAGSTTHEDFKVGRGYISFPSFAPKVGGFHLQHKQNNRSKNQTNSHPSRILHPAQTQHKMSTYAAYYNLVQADKAAKLAKQRRESAETTSSTSSAEPSRRKSSVKKFLDQLRPTEEVITPSGIYAPIIKQGPLFERRESNTGEKSSSSTPSSSRKSSLFKGRKNYQKMADEKTIEMRWN